MGRLKISGGKSNVSGSGGIDMPETLIAGFTTNIRWMGDKGTSKRRKRRKNVGGEIS